MTERKIFTRPLRVGSCTALLAMGMVWALSDPASANLGEGLCEPCFSVPYFTVNQSSAHQIESDNYSVILTIGEASLTAPVTNNKSHSAVPGFWSYYLAEPQPPLVRATDGDHRDRIDLSWEIVDDIVGPPVTGDEVLIFRNGTELTTLPISRTQYQDFNVFPGEEYEYSVVVSNQFGGSHREEEIGFLNPNGTIIGKVQTPNGNPVNNVKVVLTPDLGRSANLQDQAYIFFPEMFTGLEQSYTIEGWFRSIAAQEQTLFATVDSATTRPFARIGLTDTGALRWEHRGAGSETSDLVTTPFSYTQDGEWHHFAAVLADSNMSMTLYVDGRIAGRGTAADTIGTQKAQLVLGKQGPVQHEQYFQGRLDDWRVWSAPRTRAEIRREMDRTLEGDEGGLEAYWKFDEVKGETLFDLTDNDQDGVVCKIERSDFKAPIFVSGVTDTLGFYSIKGIYYGAGTTFTATPQKTTPIGTSLDFDGVDDYLAFPQDRLDFTGGYTIEMWFKNPGTSGENMTLFAAEDPADNSNHVRLDLLADGRLQLTHLGQSITSSEQYDNEFWYHVAATYDSGTNSLTLYVNGDAIGSETGAAIDALSAFVIARQAPNAEARYFRGWLDEIRAWDRGRTLEQVNAVKNQVLAGNETGMIAYWHFNEGDGVLTLDATGNDHIGDLVGDVPWSDDIPLNEVFTNTFDPESRQVILSPSNTSVDQVDFTDISQIAVTGFVKYSETVCFIEGAEILVNGEPLVPPRLTDANGRFVVEFEPGVRKQQISVRYKDHADSSAILPPFIELPTIVKPITGLFFEDTVKRQVRGIVAGGACKLPITPTQGQIEVELTTVDGCFTASVVPDPSTGEFTINGIPPVIYNAVLNHPNPEIDNFFTADTLSVEDHNRQVEFIYRAPPEVTISGFPVNDCGLRVMEMAEDYDLDIDIFESYSSLGDTQTCAASQGALSIFDHIGNDIQKDTVFVDGSLQYHVAAWKPNITSGGDHPFQKSIQVTATDALGRNAIVEEWTYVTGYRERGYDFATTSPDIPFFILRQPPGDGSYSFLEKEQTVATTMSMAIKTGESDVDREEVYMGPDVDLKIGGFGFSVRIKTDVTMDDIESFGVTKTQSQTTEQTYSFNTKQRYETKGDGDVFVGGALNINYGVADKLSIDESCTPEVEATFSVQPGNFATTFIYSESFIRNSVIPELINLKEYKAVENWINHLKRNAALKKNARHLPLVRDPNFEAQINSFIANDVASEEAASWLRANENSLFADLPAELIPTERNVSFAAGTLFESSETVATTSSSSFEFELTLDETFIEANGVTVSGVGAVDRDVTMRMDMGQSGLSTTATSSTTVGFVLNDDDAGDNFSVDILHDPVFSTPVFRVVSGTSSCPWIPGTIARDSPQLNISPSQQVDIAPDEAGVFTLDIGNISESGEDRTYALRLLNETNPDGAELQVSGLSIASEDGIAFNVPFGETVQGLLSFFRGPEEYVYDDLQLQLFSPCDANVYDLASVSTHFTVPCSEVDIALPENGWVFTSADTGGGHQIQVTLDGYDRLDESLERLELQYRPASGGDWFVAGAIPRAELTEDFKLVTWNISPSILPDNDYQLRARALCGIGRVPGTSPVVAGTIDRAGPKPLGAPQPSDGILHAQDEITVLFNEDINCGKISIGAGHITLTNSVTSEGIDFDFTCGGNQVVIDPNIQNTFMENLTLRASVGPVEDLLGNLSPDPVVWEFFVNRNPIEWAGLDLNNIVIFEDQSFSTTRLLTNNGGSPRSFTFTNVDIAAEPLVGPRPIVIPEWLDVEPREGTILPGAGLEIEFRVDGPVVGAGSFNTTLYASGGQGEEPRDIDIRVLCYPPDWGLLDASDYQHSMTITATLETDGELSADEFDQVGVFVDGALRGMATVQFVPVLAQLANTPAHQAFLTVYGNDADIGRELELRVWDASACLELGLVLEDFTFAANARLGTPTNPTTITATSQIIGQIALSDGWNWLSLNLVPDDLSTGAVLGGLDAGEGDFIRDQFAFSQYIEGPGWVGGLETLQSGSMYLLRLARPATLEVIGYAVDVETTSIPIVSGWNWIGYLPQNSIEVNRALASLPAQTGDIIKSQFRFAQFVEGLGWIGSLTFMNPHQAYQLFSQQAGELRYPFFEAPASKPVARPLPQVAALGWVVDPSRYEHSMVLTAEVAGQDMLDSAEDVVAAFVGDEVRGVGQTVYMPALGRHLAFVVVYSNQERGEPVEFRFFDGDAKEEGFVPTAVDFASGTALGSAAQPLALETRARRAGDRGYVPDAFVLSPSFPNPFNPSTQIGYGLPVDGRVEIGIYNVVGQRIRVLVSGRERAGYRYLTWDGRDDQGRAVPSGVYFSLMQAEGFRATQKLMLLK